MQFRAYLAILRRFWPMILLLPLLAGGISLGLALRQPARYQATVRFMVTHSPLAASASGVSLPDLNDTYTWMTTEYILDDLGLVVTSAAFAQDVAAAVGGVSPAAIQGGLSASVLHRSVYLSAVADTPEQALALLAAATDALRTKGLAYWGRGTGGLDVAILDPPQAAGTIGGSRAALTGAALRAALGLAVAVGLAMLAHYLDDRLRSPAQAEQWTGARVIASIPKE